MNIPVIDFAEYDEEKPETLLHIGSQVKKALTETGFMAVCNVGVDTQLRETILSLSQQFFSLPDVQKRRSEYSSAQENFGYQQFGAERLDPDKPADLKETFTMRNLLRHNREDPRWPSEEFRDGVSEYYLTCFAVAEKLMKVFSAVFDLPADYFIDRHGGENVTLRLLHYPAQQQPASEQQLGAGAHTDYGMFTLLIQDDVGGLEVQGVDGQWYQAPYREDAVIVNSGDLLCRWSNDLLKSTMHRVKPVYGDRDRYSVACFFDPDDDVIIDAIANCVAAGETPKYPPITTRDHLLQKIQATHVGT